jgi:membrane associated rhomboid family serine protease
MELSITVIIIVITSGVSLLTMQKPDVLYKLMMNPYMIAQRGQYYRLLTSGFIHKDHMHLIFNMFTFYFFGSQLEYIFQYIFGPTGNIYYIILYLMGIIVSDFFVLCFPGFILGAVYLIYSYMSAKKSSTGINHDAHLFGALFGVVYCIVLYPDSIRIFLEQMAEWKLF